MLRQRVLFSTASIAGNCKIMLKEKSDMDYENLQFFSGRPSPRTANEQVPDSSENIHPRTLKIYPFQILWNHHWLISSEDENRIEAFSLLIY